MMLPGVYTLRTFCVSQAKGTQSLGALGTPGTGPGSGTGSAMGDRPSGRGGVACPLVFGAGPRVEIPRRTEILPQPAFDLRRRFHPLAGPPKTPRPGLAHTLRRALLWQAELASGQVRNRAAIAHREGLSRARVTQIMGLLQEA